MELKKTILSIILLATYTLGLAFNTTAVCQDLAIGETEISQHHHDHHEHIETESITSDHEHLVHEDHLDEGWYDFIVCFLSDLEHSQDKCHTIQTSQFLFKRGNSINDVSKIVAAISFFFYGISIEEESDEYGEYYVNNYSSPCIHNISDRGPPIYSC